MVAEYPRWQAVLLMVALIGTSCKGTTEMPGEGTKRLANGGSGPTVAAEMAASKPVGEQPLAVAKPAAEQPLEQSPSVQAPQTVAEQRRDALVGYWLENARKLRVNGKLEDARSELMKAREMAPNDAGVAAELAAVRAELGPAGADLMSGIAKQRAVAHVQFQLQTAEQLMAQKNYAGAIEALRRAELAIEMAHEADWGDLPAQVKAARAKAERLKDAGAPEQGAHTGFPAQPAEIEHFVAMLQSVKVKLTDADIETLAASLRPKPAAQPVTTGSGGSGGN
jgi:tetratricopeptide (TPR) repeat protein